MQRYIQITPLTITLFFLSAVYVVYFSMFSIFNYQFFEMTAYDAGIHFQAIWKLANGEGLFNTVRGLAIWGDHLWFIMVLYLPIYILFPYAETLLILQSLALGSAVIPLAALMLHFKIDNRVIVLFCLCWLVSPALQNMNLEQFHPEAFATPMLLWMIERAVKQRWRGYYVCFAIALLCKEDIALTTAALGVWIALSHRRQGFWTIGISLLWFLLCMKVWLPLFNETGFFRVESGYWFSNFWKEKFNLDFYLTTFFNKSVLFYLWQLGAPLLFIFLLHPTLALAALPSLAINILSGNAYLMSIEYHYVNQILPILFAASALAYVRLTHRFQNLQVLPIAIAITLAGLIANTQWSHTPLQNAYALMSAELDRLGNDKFSKNVNRLIALLPDRDTPISVSYNLLPNLANRPQIYMYPNPYVSHYWGIREEAPISGDSVRALLIDTRVMATQHLDYLAGQVERGEFKIVGQVDNILLAERLDKVVPRRLYGPKHVLPSLDSIRVHVYPQNEELTHLVPLLFSIPAQEFSVKRIKIPETQGELWVGGVNTGVSDNVRVDFIGQWNAKGVAPIRFKINADDGAIIYIDDKLAFDYNGVHGFNQSAVSNKHYLSPGPHKIAVSYFEWGGNAGLSVQWSADGKEFKPLELGQTLP